MAMGPHREGHPQAPQTRAREGAGGAQPPTSAARCVIAGGLFAVSMMGPPSSAAGAAAVPRDPRARSPRPPRPPPPPASTPDAVGALDLALTVGPIAGYLPARGLLAGVGAGAASARPASAQTRLSSASTPSPGLRNLLGPNLVFEALKAVAKVAVVGGVAALAILPGHERAGLRRRHPPAAPSARCCGNSALASPSTPPSLTSRSALIDYAWKRRRHEHSCA